MWIIKFYSFDLDLHSMTLILKLNLDIEQTGRLDWNYYLSAWADGKQAVACTYFKSHMNCVKTYFLQAKVLARSPHMCRRWRDRFAAQRMQFGCCSLMHSVVGSYCNSTTNHDNLLQIANKKHFSFDLFCKQNIVQVLLSYLVKLNTVLRLGNKFMNNCCDHHTKISFKMN